MLYSGSKAASPDDCQGYGKRQPLAAPFGTDDISAWERESDSYKEKVNSMAPTNPIITDTVVIIYHHPLPLFFSSVHLLS